MLLTISKHLYPPLLRAHPETLLTHDPAALADALEMLGFGAIYHMREVRKNGHTAMWIEALEAKFEGKGKQYGKEEWDTLMGGFGVSCALFFATKFGCV